MFAASATLPAADPIVHQITLPAGQSWCDDSMIHGLLIQVNKFRSENGLVPLKMDKLGMKTAEVRATEFIGYMATHAPNSPGFNPHTGWDTTASRLGYNAISENLAYMMSDPAAIVYNGWQGPLHRAAMLASDANVAGVSCVNAGFSPFWTFVPGSCVGSSCGQVSAPPDPLALSSEQWAFLTLINNFRAQSGLGPLGVSAALQSASQWHSEDMAAKNYTSHTDSLGRDVRARLLAFNYSWSPWGENIAGGYSDAQNTFNQWLNACDPDASGACTYAHRKNMLGAGFTAIGIGRAYNANSPYGWYWTTDFGGYVERRIEPGTSPAAPVIVSFTATPSVVAKGQSSTLSWSVTGAASITIDNGVGTVAAVSTRSVAPAQTTSYRLTATNSSGSAVAVATVTVKAAASDVQPPTTPVDVTASVSTGEVRLTWSASTDNIGVTGYQVLRNGTALGSTTTTTWSDRAVQSATAYTYQVRAYDAAGNFSLAGIVQVSTPAPSGTCGTPATGVFTGCYYGNTDLLGAPVLVRTDARIAFSPYGAFPPDAVPFEAFSVRWQGNFAFEGGTYTFSSVASDGMRVYLDGSLVLDKWADQLPTTVYTTNVNISAGNHLVAVEYYSRSGRPAAHLSWSRTGGTVPSGPAITSFAATPALITAGQTATLAWSVTGATSVSIDNGLGTVPAVSSRSVSPSQTTTYKLTATGSGGTTTASVTLTVAAVSRDTQPPSTPGSPSAAASSPTQVKLVWTASTDNIGVAAYRIARNGIVLATVPHPGLSYIDATAVANTAYTYSVTASDVTGNMSSAAIARVTTPAPSGGAVTCGTAVSGAFGACYYGNTALSGAPLLSRTDAQINFGTANPFPAEPIPSAGFSVRWDGVFPFDGDTYTFTITASDGIRLYIDGTLMLDRWLDQPSTRYFLLRTLTPGAHRITVEYYSQTAPASAQVMWAKRL